MEAGPAGSDRAVVVLLVEDSRTDAELMESMLGHSQAARFDVTVAGTLADGLAWLARRSPDIILLDLTLPDSERLATYRAASRVDQNLSFAREATIARRLCAERGMAIGSDGVQLLGGHGYVKEHPVERWYRDLRAAGVMEGGLVV